MRTGRRRSGRRTPLGWGAALLVGAALALAGCAPGVPRPALTAPPASDSKVRIDSDIPYRTVGDVSLTLDVCRPPEDTGPLPTVMLLHGGGFEVGDKTAMRSLCEMFAENGAAAVSVQYRLLPDFSFPSQVEDAAAAVQWIASPDNAEKYGFDPSRIGVLGSSAGAIIAESLGTGMGGDGSQVAAVVALSGAANLTPSGLHLGKPGPDAQKVVLGYLGCTKVLDCPASADASPLMHVSASSAPMLLIAGSDELVPKEQSVAMQGALKAAGVSADVLVEDGTSHGLALLSTESKQAIRDFFNSHL